ncbi:MAG: PAC2 family protein [Candidatus Parvarchaeota archaeon]
MAFEIPLEVEEKVMSGRAAEKRYALLGFGGWPDAGRVASLTVEYFARALKAEKLMELDCSEIHDSIGLCKMISIDVTLEKLGLTMHASINFPKLEKYFISSSSLRQKRIYMSVSRLMSCRTIA